MRKEEAACEIKEPLRPYYPEMIFALATSPKEYVQVSRNAGRWTSDGQPVNQLWLPDVIMYFALLSMSYVPTLRDYPDRRLHDSS